MVFLRTWSGRRGAEVTREARLTEKTKTTILKLFMTSTKSSYFGKSLAVFGNFSNPEVQGSISSAPALCF